MNREKIIFIIPKDHAANDPLIYPNLGLLYIAAIIDRKSDYNVLVYDMREESNTIESIPESEVYGFTCATSQIHEVIKISKYLKERNKNCFTIIGGHYPSWSHENIINDFDAIIVGEGENLILDILENKRKGVFRSNFKELMHIDDIPFPARYLLPKERVVNTNIISGYGYKSEEISTTLITIRGCPHKCHWCANVPQKVRFRNPKLVLEETKILIEEYGCKALKLLDDDFLISFEHMKEICLGFKKLGIKFRCAARSDNVNEEKCKILKDCGCEEIALGIEVIDSNILKKMNKKETVEDHIRAIEAIRKYNIPLRYYLMVGIPGQTQKEIDKTKEFLKKYKPNKCTISMFMPYPGCAIYNNPDKFRIEIDKENFQNYFQLYPNNDPPYKTKECSKEEIKKQHENLLKFWRELEK